MGAHQRLYRKYLCDPTVFGLCASSSAGVCCAHAPCICTRVYSENRTVIFTRPSNFHAMAWHGTAVRDTCVYAPALGTSTKDWCVSARTRRQSTLPSARRTFCGVIGCEYTCAPNGASASLMAFMTAAGAPAVPASPAPFAPSLEVAVGV